MCSICYFEWKRERVDIPDQYMRVCYTCDVILYEGMKDESYCTKEVLTHFLLGTPLCLRMKFHPPPHTHTQIHTSGLHTHITESKTINCHQGLPISEIFHSGFEMLSKKTITSLRYRFFNAKQTHKGTDMTKKRARIISIQSLSTADWSYNEV